MSTAIALGHLRAGDTDHALALLDTQQEHDAGWHAAHGMVLLAIGQPDAARAALSMAISRGDASPSTLLNLALAEDGSGDATRARALIQALTLQVPDWDEPWLRLAESWRREGDQPRAATAYMQALDRDPTRAEALLGLAALRIGAGDGAAAQTLLLRCLGRAPERVDAWNALGLALLQTNDAAAAEAAFAEAQSRAPGDYDLALRGSMRPRPPGMRRRNWRAWNRPRGSIRSTPPCRPRARCCWNSTAGARKHWMPWKPPSPWRPAPQCRPCCWGICWHARHAGQTPSPPCAMP